MGTSRSATELAGKFGRLATNIQQGRKDLVFDVSLAGKDIVQRNMTAAGVPKKIRSGGRIGVNFNVKGTHNPTSLLRVRGPAHWWEGGTGPHTVVSKKAGRSRRARGQLEPGPGMFAGTKRRGAVRTPRGVRAYARHPGMRARPFWQVSKRQVGVASGRILKANTGWQIRKAGFR